MNFVSKSCGHLDMNNFTIYSATNISSSFGSMGQMTVTDKLGLGTSDPAEKLHVDGNIVAYNYDFPSDVRIKKNIQSVDTQWALDKISALRPISYNYIDPLINQDLEYGYLAQEVRDILPFSVMTLYNAVPNIYKECYYTVEKLEKNVYSYSFTCENDLVAGDRVKLKFTPNTSRVVEVKHATPATFTFQLAEFFSGGHAFVYGKFVNDFLTVDSAEINAIHLAATKQLDAELNATKKSLELAYERINTLEKQIAEILLQLK